MNALNIALVALVVAASLSLLALLGNKIALKQVRAERYSHVPLVKCLRWMQYPSLAALVVFIATGLVSSLGLNLLLLVAATCLAVIIQQLSGIPNERIKMCRLYIPVIATTMVSGNLGISTDGLDLPLVAVVLSCISMYAFWAVSELRHQQDMAELFGY